MPRTWAQPMVPMMMRIVLFLAALFAAAPVLACGPDTDCEVDGGSYRLLIPDGADGPVPALLWLHGWGGSAEGVMKNRSMRERLTQRGYALIAPLGLPRAEHRNRDWGVRDEGTHPRDDIAFLEAVLSDAASRGVDPERVLAGGFSRGGSMVWDLACRAPGSARAYAPVAGAFWEPLPDGCAGPVDLFHSHGWTDRIVPLEGRSVANGTLTQGDVFASLAILRETNGCDARQPESAPMSEDGTLWERRWTDCSRGRIDLMLWPGGHGIPPGWLDRALDWFEALNGPA